MKCIHMMRERERERERERVNNFQGRIDFIENCVKFLTSILCQIFLKKRKNSAVY